MGYESILLDIETQRDFFAPGGSCYRRSASRAARHVYELFQWARANCIPVLSTVLRVRRFERGPLSAIAHCIEGTNGEQKLPRTILRSRINLGLRNITDLPRDIFENHQQVIIEKRHTDVFLHARAERLITQLRTGTFFICGAGLARGVVQAAIGLRSRGFAVIVAQDATLDLHDRFAKMAHLRMEAKGVVFAPTQNIVVPRPEQRIVTVPWASGSPKPGLFTKH